MGGAQLKAGFIGIPQLPYIKNRDKVVSRPQFAKSLEVYSRLQKFAVNEYEDSLWQFECRDEGVMRQLTRMVYYHNCRALVFPVAQQQPLHNYEEPLIVYVDRVLRRTCAAVTIQKTWRRYTSNKTQAQSIHHKMKKNRAVLHIQRFFRNSIHRHRHSFSKQLASQLAQLHTPTLLYPLSLYIHLQALLAPRPQSVLFKQLRLTRQGQQIGLTEQFYRPVFQQNIRDTYFEGQRLGTESHSNEVDLFNLFHLGVKVAILEKDGNSFISLTYSSEAKANMVASIVALLTYQFWGGEFVWPLSKDSLAEWPERMQQYQRVKKIEPSLRLSQYQLTTRQLTQQKQ